MSNDSKTPQPGGQFLVYQTQDGKLKIDVRFEGETVWLTQQQMADLFQTSVPNISMHVRNVFAEGELRADSVVKESLTAAADAKDDTTRLERMAPVKESLTTHRFHEIRVNDQYRIVFRFVGQDALDVRCADHH